MASPIAKSSMVAVAVLMIGGLFQCAWATSYLVGGTAGWTFPSTPTFYDDWAKQYKFKIGDELVFVYDKEEHNVFEVTQSAFSKCQTSSPIGIYTESNATVHLTIPGYHAFICQFPGHCDANVKMQLHCDYN